MPPPPDLGRRPQPSSGGEGRRPPWRLLVDTVRITHPFPSAIDAGVVAALATIDRAPVPAVATISVSMLLLQASIGAFNDLTDEDRDSGRADKPIATGSIRREAAIAVASGLAGAGLLLAALRGPGLFGVAVLGLACGLLYDLALRGTAWSWLPFAIGIPLLPVFAWLGGSGCVPPAALLIVPLAVVAGAQLALANALADLEADAATGVASVASVLGATRGWRLSAFLSVVVATAALASVALLGGRGPAVLVVAAGMATIAGAAGLSRGPGTGARQAGWALDCLGMGILAAGWVGAVAGSAILPVPPC